MDLRSFGYGYSGELGLDFHHAVPRVKDALARHGFGVQAEIPISDALKQKIGAEIPRELILGVCNPGLAHRAIQIEPDVTVLLPCNITIRESATGVHVSTADAKMLVNATHNPKLEPIAAEAESQLLAALREL